MKNNKYNKRYNANKNDNRKKPIKKQRAKEYLLILIPFVILLVAYILFPSIGFQWKWINNASQDGWLAFWGSFLGGAITILGVIIPIYIQNRMEKRKRINAIKPFLISSYTQEYHNDFVKITKDDDLFVTINRLEGPAPVVIGTMKEPPSWIEFDYKPLVINHRMSLNFTNNNLCFNYSLSNIGYGNSLNIFMKINSIPVTPHFSLASGDKRLFHIIINTEKISEGQEYLLKIEYDYKNADSSVIYNQYEVIAITKDKNGPTSSQQLNKFLCDNLSESWLI